MKTQRHYYSINMRLLSFIVTLVVLLLLSLYFVRTYIARQQSVVHNMKLEATILETLFVDDLNYSKYLAKLIAREIKTSSLNSYNIKKIFKNHAQAASSSQHFGWKQYSWINARRKIISARNSEEQNLYDLERIGQFLKDNIDNKENIYFTGNKKHNNLKLYTNINSEIKNEYLGFLVLSYDVNNMITRFNAIKRNSYTNFVILDEQLNVIAQSKPIINNIIIDTNDTKSTYLIKGLSKLDSNPLNDVSYVEMFSGVNHYIKKIPNLPFILIINLDTEEIRNNILDSIVRKFMEVMILASIFVIVLILIYKREVMLRTQAEQATKIANKATEAKSNFLTFTAHEIRSPLGFIMTGSEIMLKELLGIIPEAYKKYTEGIYKNSKVILEFITDILDENQIIAGKFKIVNSMVGIGSIIEEAINNNKARFYDRYIEIKTQISDDLPKLICDQRRILQVINNVLSNAIKYSPDGSEINIKAQVIGDTLEINVKDQGIGMNAEEINIALSLYGAPQKENHHFFDSYGLGLPIVKMLLEAHSAELVISSEKKIGTEVKMIFPKFKLIYDN